MSFRGPVVAIPKPANVYRIILLGGSTTYGYSVDDSATIDAYMRRMLAERAPGRVFEVINLGFDGYDSYQDYERFRSDGMRLEPDLVIVNSGINDVRNARFENLRDADPRTLIWEPDLRRLREEQRNGGPSLRTRIKHYSYLARLKGIIRERIVGRVDIYAAQHTTPHPEAATLFEQNLRRVDSVAAARGIPVLFSTPPSRLKYGDAPDSRSERTYWLIDAATTQQYRDELDHRMRSVVADLGTRGRKVGYVPHDLGPAVFLDDCHLMPEGNRQVAADFVRAVLALVEPGRPRPTHAGAAISPAGASVRAAANRAR